MCGEEEIVCTDPGPPLIKVEPHPDENQVISFLDSLIAGSNCKKPWLLIWTCFRPNEFAETLRFFVRVMMGFSEVLTVSLSCYEI